MVPSVMAAILKHLKSDGPTNTLTAGRISGELLGPTNDPLNPKWPMPCKCIIAKPLGGSRPDRATRRQSQRIQLDCYGEKGYIADQVWRTAHHALIPVSGRLAFIVDGCVVYDIIQESGMVAIPDGSWPRTIVSYTVDYSEVAFA
jgi:hypothetical protein